MLHHRSIRALATAVSRMKCKANRGRFAGRFRCLFHALFASWRKLLTIYYSVGGGLSLQRFVKQIDVAVSALLPGPVFLHAGLDNCLPTLFVVTVCVQCAVKGRSHRF